MLENITDRFTMLARHRGLMLVFTESGYGRAARIRRERLSNGCDGADID